MAIRSMLALVAAVAAGVTPRSGHGADAPGPWAVVEYLPPLVYYRESIFVRIGVENPRATAALATVEITIDASGEAERQTQRVDVEVPPLGRGQAGFDLPAAAWASARVELVCEGAATDVVAIRRFDESGAIPRLEARGELLYVAQTHEAAIVSLTQRASKPDREWYLWKRFAERLSEGSLPAGAILLGSGLNADGGSEPPYMRKVRERAGTWVEAVPLPGERAADVIHPILADLAAALDTLDTLRHAELVVWVAGCDDARRATPLRTFRKAADLIMCRARQAGASRLSIMFVPEPAVPGDRRSLYAEELLGAVSAYGGIMTRLDELEETACWVSPAAVESRALMRHLNDAGHDALAAAILTKVTR